MDRKQEVATRGKVGEVDNVKKWRKVYWRCAVPGCFSGKLVPSHSFPKNPELSSRWRTAINNPELDHLDTEELRSYKICHLHFLESAYKVTAVRRMLKEDAVPELRLQMKPAIGEFVHTDDHESLQKDSSSVDNASNVIPSCEAPVSAVQTSICATPSTSKIRRPILGSITRKNNLTPTAHRLHGSVVNLLKKQTKMLDDKVFALAILKQSAQSYRLLSRVFISPTPRSLRTFLNRISLKPGINKVVFEHLKEQGLNMTDEEKVCVLLWDEVSLQPQIYFNEKNDKIVGFEDWGNARTNKFSDHALVFMLRGIKRNWKIPLTYNFCKSCTSAAQLSRCIKELVRAVSVAGFNVVATVCDQGQTNVSGLNILLTEARATCIREKKSFSGRIKIGGTNIIPLYDPPHLIKGIRNNLLSKDIEVAFEETADEDRRNDTEFAKIQKYLLGPEFIDEINLKTATVQDSGDRYFASWDIVELAYDIDTKSLNTIKRQMPRLNDSHIRRNKIQKMRVKPAVQAMCRTMAAFIRHLTCVQGTVQTVEGEKWMPKKEGIVTSEVVKFFNDSFDSVNGGKREPKESRNVLRCAVTERSLHANFWREAVNCMAKNVKFVDRHTKKYKIVPSLKNFTTTLNGFQKLWQVLRKLGFKSFEPRNINQDPLENFFRMIRSHGGRNNNPTCSQFESSFKTLLINNVTSAKTVKGNCEDDEAKRLFALRNFTLMSQTIENEGPSHETGEDNYIISADSNLTRSGTCMDSSQILMRIRKDIRIKNCDTCQTDICHLKNFDIILKEAYSNLESNIPFFCSKRGVVENLIMPLSLIIDFPSLTCTDHFDILRQALLRAITVDYVKNWCNNINKLLKGKDSGARAQCFLTKQALTQYAKKLKIKNR